MSALASTWRESWLPGTRARARRAPARARRRAAPPGPARSTRCGRTSAAAELAGEQQPERRDDDHEGEPARDVVVRDVAELVGDDRAARARLARREQVVVEDDALGRADPVDVGVERADAAARVDPVDLADVDPGAPGELEHLGRGPGSFAGSGSNLLKSGARTTGASQTNTAAIAATAHRAGDPPAAARSGAPGRSAARAPAAASTAPIAADLATSPSHEPNVWVEMPKSTARSCAAMPPAGRRPQRHREAGAGDRRRPAPGARAEPLEARRTTRGRPSASATSTAPSRRAPPMKSHAGRRCKCGPRSISAGGEVVGSRTTGAGWIGRRAAAAARPPPRRRAPSPRPRRRPRASVGLLARSRLRRMRPTIVRRSCAWRSSATSTPTCPPSRRCSATIDDAGVEETGAWATWSATAPSPTTAPRWSASAATLCLVGNHDLAVLGELDISAFSPARPRRRCAGRRRRRSRDARLPARAGAGRREPRGGPLPRVAPRPGLGVRALARPGRRVHRGPGGAREPGRPLARRAVLRLPGRPGRRRRRSAARRRRRAPRPAAAPLDLAEGRWLINPGSVGQPRDGDPRAAWLELDTDAWQATYHRVAYDIDRAAAAIAAAGLPEHLARRLYMGQ